MKVLIDGIEYVPVAPATIGLQDGYVSEHFRLAEFTCNHCGQITNDPPDLLLQYLEDMRAHFGGKPVTITSAYRCKTHNDNVGSSDGSRHRVWDAVDIQVSGVAPKSVYDYFNNRFPNQYGLGRYDSFTHFDIRDHKARW